MPKPKNPEPPRARRPQTVEELRAEFWASIAEERRLRAEGEKRRDEADRRREEAEAERREAEAKAEAERREAEDQRRAEAEAKREEADRRREEAEAKRAEAEAKHDAQVKKEMAALRRSIDGIGKNTGDFARNTGRILERDVLAKIKHDGGIGPVKGGLLSRPDREETGEYDGVIINGQETVVLEIKRNLLLKDVRKFLDKQLPRFVREFPALARGRKVYGALAFQLDADDGKAVDLARENGLMLVRINSRRRIEVLNPDTAQLRNIAG